VIGTLASTFLFRKDFTSILKALDEVVEFEGRKGWSLSMSVGTLDLGLGEEISRMKFIVCVSSQFAGLVMACISSRSGNLVCDWLQLGDVSSFPRASKCSNPMYG